jgi:serine/threonine-protein phosphatase 2A regulatory subunit B
VKGSADAQVTDADIISTVEFNQTGELLATGDKGGRIVIFCQAHDVPAKYGEYCVYSTFQSHEPEFDYLKSLEIEEKINKIKWLPQHNSSHYLLSTNDKTIKLWKIQQKNRKTSGFNLRDEEGNPKELEDSLIVPRYVPTELMIEASPRRVFSNAHTYHINSISLNSDLETFMSADDLRINLWNLSITDQSFNIVDIKPANMEELSEVITAAEFHPHHCNIFAYSSSRGNVKLCDMRLQALCDSHAKLFEQSDDDQERSTNFFSEIISSLSDVKFSHSGRYMLTRDYLTVKIWDLNMEKQPVATFQVHPTLRHKLCWLYENDSIFDKFECSWSHDDRHIITGSYQNRFRIFNLETQSDYTFEASRELYPGGVGRQPLKSLEDIESGRFDTVKKQLYSAWHPAEDVIALAANDNLYLFAGLPQKDDEL